MAMSGKSEDIRTKSIQVVAGDVSALGGRLPAYFPFSTAASSCLLFFGGERLSMTRGKINNIRFQFSSVCFGARGPLFNSSVLARRGVNIMFYYSVSLNRLDLDHFFPSAYAFPSSNTMSLDAQLPQHFTCFACILSPGEYYLQAKPSVTFAAG